MLAAACLVMACAGCSTSGPREPLARNLPLEPAFAREVMVSDPRVGEDMLVVAARERAGRLQANAVIRRFRGWYGDVRRSYGAE